MLTLDSLDLFPVLSVEPNLIGAVLTAIVAALEALVGVVAGVNLTIGYHEQPTIYNHNGEVLWKRGMNLEPAINIADIVGHKRVPGASTSMAEAREVVEPGLGVIP